MTFQIGDQFTVNEKILNNTLESDYHRVHLEKTVLTIDGIESGMHPYRAKWIPGEHLHMYFSEEEMSPYSVLNSDEQYLQGLIGEDKHV